MGKNGSEKLIQESEVGNTSGKWTWEGTEV
jgi:hypothetical protein